MAPLGCRVTCNYRGRCRDAPKGAGADATWFDDSFSRGEPLSFRLG